MRVFHSYADLPEIAKGASIAIGNFDGLHAGHLAVIEDAKAAAVKHDTHVGVMMFDPPPVKLFRPDGPPFRLMSVSRRAQLLARDKVDFVYAIPFDRQISQMTDEDFVREILVDGLAVKAVTVGYDFCFGRNRMGDAQRLIELGEQYGFDVSVTGKVSAGDEKYGSTRVREVIAEGDMTQARELLGHHWVIEAIIEHGEKRGRTIGFPTANLKLGEFVHPKHGIYAVWMRLNGEDDWRPGVANFGRTPTTGMRDPLLEVYLFDFDGDLYGKPVEVAFRAFIRPEEHFDSLETLVAQMHRDTNDARKILSAATPPK